MWVFGLLFAVKGLMLRFLSLMAVSTLALAGCSQDIGSTSDGPGGTGTAFGADAAPGSSGLDTCARVSVELTSQTPTVLLVVDRSGSMDEKFGGTNRWGATYSTLMDPTTGVVGQLEDSVRFGVALYTSKGGSGGSKGLDGQPAGTCPMVAGVAPALGNHAAIDAMYAPKGPVGDTPTGAALVQATASLQAVTEPGPKVLVIATDGEPDSCTYPNPDNRAEADSARQEVIVAAQAAHTAGIATYVISVGDQVGAAHLQQVANAGRGLAATGGTNATYYQALNPAELITAFGDIIADIRSCTLTLDGEVDPATSDGTVTLDGQQLTQGSDWRFKNSTSIEILAASCEKIIAGGDHSISAEFSCDAVGIVE